jgi:hypothetical protein
MEQPEMKAEDPKNAAAGPDPETDLVVLARGSATPDPDAPPPCTISAGTHAISKLPLSTQIPLNDILRHLAII